MVAPAPNAVAAELKASIQAARQRMARLGMGAGGIEVCRELSDAYDGVVRGLWDDIAQRVPGAERMALVATGGWGRRELCPFSDIDFILLGAKRELGAAKQLADQLLYPLWDAGIEVGHAVRDPASAARLAKDDLATATSLLDLRCVAGNQELVRELEHATRRAIAPGGNANDFVARLVAEKQSRHDRFGDSLYLLEPNLKNGIGALRDLATAVWAARARWSVSELSELVSMGYATPRQVAVLEAARDFLLELRTLVQLTSGRRTDQLTFEIQEAIAPKLYPDTRVPEGDVRPAVAHGFDDEGRKYDASGRLTEWWEPPVAEAFEQRVACVVEQYDGYQALPGKHVNGELTAGENIADIGGVKEAYFAYQAWAAERGGDPAVAEGMSNEQVFFVAWAQNWCQHIAEPELERRLVVDPHSPGEFRAVGPLVNLPEFADAFSCAEGTPMNPPDRCEIW